MSGRFRRVAFENQQALAVQSVATHVLERLSADPEQPFCDPASDLVKQDEFSRVIRWTVELDGQPYRVAYKQVRAGTRLKQLRQSIVMNKAWQSWWMAARLIKLGIPTAAPVLAIRPRYATLNGSTFVATEWLSRAFQVDHFIQQRPGDPAEWRIREGQAATSLAELLGRLHRCGYMHRDLKVANLMLRIEANDVAAYLVDLDGVRRLPLVPVWRRMKDLARLSVCFPDDAETRNALRRKFLHAYLSTLQGHDRHWKAEWRLLEAATERLRRKKQQRAA